jgi:hypothetical protein
MPHSRCTTVRQLGRCLCAGTPTEIAAHEKIRQLTKIKMPQQLFRVSFCPRYVLYDCCKNNFRHFHHAGAQAIHTTPCSMSESLQCLLKALFSPFILVGQSLWWVVAGPARGLAGDHKTRIDTHVHPKSLLDASCS